MKTGVLIALFLLGSVLMASAQAVSQKTGFINESGLSEKVISVDLFPNPATDFLNIKVNQGKLDLAKVEVFSIIGNKLSLPVTNLSDKIVVDVRDLASGIYVVVLSGHEPQSRKTIRFYKK